MINTSRKLVLVSMLPGLGKSTLAKNHQNVIDYEDWMEANDLQYKNADHRDTINHLNIMLQENVFSGPLFVFSSIHWEDMEDDRIKSNVLIHMKPGLYNSVELLNRGREDLLEKFSDEEFTTWNNDYTFLTQGKKSILLDNQEFVDIDWLVSNGYTDDFFAVSMENTIEFKQLT